MGEILSCYAIWWTRITSIASFLYLARDGRHVSEHVCRFLRSCAQGF